MELIISNYGDTAERVGTYLERSARKAQNMREIMEAIALDMLRIEGIIFSSGGRRGGGSWKQLKPDTIRKKGTSEILRTGGARETYIHSEPDALYESMTRMGAPHQLLTITNDSIELSSDAPGALYSQIGAPEKNVPARPFLRFLESDVNRWSEMIVEHLLAYD